MFQLFFGRHTRESLFSRQFHGPDCISIDSCLDCIRLGKRYGIKVIPGVDFRNGVEQMFVAIAKTNEGFQQINELLTHHLHTGEPIPATAPKMDDVWVIYPFEKTQTLAVSNEYIGVQPYELQRLFQSWARRVWRC